MDTLLTIAEIQPLLDPAMNKQQVRTLIEIAGIQVARTKRVSRVGRPSFLYSAAAIMQAHGEETARTKNQFSNADWIASALLARKLIRAEPEPGELWWPDGTRAEHLLPSHYGAVRAGPCQVLAHRVIWIAAEGEIPPGIQVNHVNRLRWDNRRANLELVTLINNIRHAWGGPYLNTADEGRRSRVPLPPPPDEDIDQALIRGGGSLIRDGGIFRRAGH
jgi:hypothetical protein